MAKSLFKSLNEITQQLSYSDNISELEYNRRGYLVISLSIIGSLFLLAFAATSLASGSTRLALFLCLASLVGLFNSIWLYRSHQLERATHALSLLVVCLGVLLIASGGHANSGMLWAYPLVPIIVFVSGFVYGSVYCTLLFIIAALILYWPDSPLLLAQYPEAMKSRFVFTLLATNILCAITEFSRANSQLKLENLNTQVEKAANTDALTGLLNRRYVHDELLLNDQFPPSWQGSTSIILCDIDHFKAFNDNHGHQLGDLVLQRVAQAIKANTRSSDYVVRWGGEEFLLILPGASRVIALSRAERIRSVIAQLEIDVKEAVLHVNLSMGVHAHNVGESVSASFRQADEALYRAKNEGRNCVR